MCRCINLGALSLIATPFMEKYEGFWTAFLLCFCMFNVGIATLILRRKSFVVRPPQGSIITDAFKALGMMITARNMDAPKPSWRAQNGKTKPVPWSDHFVEELKRALRACKVFVFYPVFWVCYGQFSSNFVTQASQMQGHGMPNDEMQNFDPISILVFIPILDRIVYPLLRRAGFELRPMARITIGFVLASFSLAYAAGVQALIYQSGPCFKDPLNTRKTCPAGQLPDGTVIPNNVHIAIQTPAYIFIGVSEIFISVTGLEYAYTKAPASMKSFVQSMYLFTNAFGSALNEALVPVLVDPKILWMYTGVACFAFGTAIAFWFIFHHYDDEEEKMYALDRDVSSLTGCKSDLRPAQDPPAVTPESDLTLTDLLMGYDRTPANPSISYRNLPTKVSKRSRSTTMGRLVKRWLDDGIESGCIGKDVISDIDYILALPIELVISSRLRLTFVDANLTSSVLFSRSNSQNIHSARGPKLAV